MLTIKLTLAVVVGIDMAMMTFGHQRLRNFLNLVPRIRNRMDLDSLKRVAAIQMHVSLLHVCACTAVTSLFILGWRIADYPRAAVLLWAAVMVITNLLAYRGWRTASLVRAIPLANPALAPQRKRVVESWRNRVLPDW